jgi:hypothetical protein
MAVAAQRALPFEVAEPFHYHDVNRHGFVALLHPNFRGQMKQKSYLLRDLPAVVREMYGKTNVWISQGEFWKPNRRAVNLWRMPVAYADLDVHKMPGLQSMSTEAQVSSLLMCCDDRGIPQPSLVVFSGRGLQAKWLFSEPVPRKALPRWSAVQRTINQQLQDFGADPKALDASRVLRLVDTASSRSAEPVRLVHVATTPAGGGERLSTGAVGYDFDLFADAILPLTRDELAQRRASRAAERERDASEREARLEAKRSRLVLIQGSQSYESKRHAGHSPLVPSQLAWDRLADLRTLAEIRGFEQGLPSGQRNLFVFLAACFLADACVVPDLLPEVVELAKEFAPTWSNAEVVSCVSSVLSRASASGRGEKVQFGGRTVDPRYRWKNETLMDWLSVLPEEECRLQTIIGKNEKQRRDTIRHRKARREAGVVPRDVYLADVEKRRQEARAYRDLGWSFRAIAEKLEVSPGTVANYCR